MALITTQELEDAQLDVQTLEDIVNQDTAGDVLSRLGTTHPNARKMLQSFPSYQGTWSGATTYALGHVVARTGSSYISLQSDNLNHTPESSPTWWGLLASIGNTGATGDEGPQGPQGNAGYNPCTSDVNLNNAYRCTNSLNPTSNQDLVTKIYADDRATRSVWRASDFTTTSPGTVDIDGLSIASLAANTVYAFEFLGFFGTSVQNQIISMCFSISPAADSCYTSFGPNFNAGNLTDTNIYTSNSSSGAVPLGVVYVGPNLVSYIQVQMRGRFMTSNNPSTLTARWQTSAGTATIRKLSSLSARKLVA